ncbi:MAG: DUF4013 domain-containing protein [Verrucomicrobiota bacterium]
MATETPDWKHLDEMIGLIFADQEAWRKVLIGGLLCLSIVGLPWAFGYFSRYLEQIRRTGDFSLPEWSNFMALLPGGLQALGVFALWFCFPWLLSLAVPAILGAILSPLAVIGYILSEIVLWMICGLYVSALWLYQKEQDWASVINVENVWAPFAAQWKSLLVPGLAFVGLTGALLPVLPFVFFGGFLPYMAYTLQVYVLGQRASEAS